MDIEKYLKITFIFLFIIFISIYVINKDGYYNYELKKRIELTNEQIVKFENDVKNNNNIDINNYIENTTKDYSSNISNMSNSFSNFTSKYIKKCIKGILNIILKLMS